METEADFLNKMIYVFIQSNVIKIHWGHSMWKCYKMNGFAAIKLFFDPIFSQIRELSQNELCEFKIQW